MCRIGAVLYMQYMQYLSARRRSAHARGLPNAFSVSEFVVSRACGVSSSRDRGGDHGCA